MEDSFARPLMWNIPHAAELLFYALIPLVVLGFLAGVVWRARKWFLGRPEPDAPSVKARLQSVLRPAELRELLPNIFFQWRLSSDRSATAIHLAIFWGMAILFAGTALATVDQDFTNLPFDFQFLKNSPYRLFELALDLFGVHLVAGLAAAVYRRYWLAPKRLKPARAPISKWDGFPFLATLVLIALTGFAVEGLRLAEGFQIDRELAEAGGTAGKLQVLEQLGVGENLHVGQERREAELSRIAAQGTVFPAAAWAPVGYSLGKAMAPLSLDSIRRVHRDLWWVHGLLAFGFMLCIPWTKAFHLISSPANMLLRNPGPPGRLPVAAESGVRILRDFTWRQLLQVDACTWCGKCQDVCPANNTGSSLSPRDVVHALQSQLLRTARRTNGDATELHGRVIAPADLWVCYTCRACAHICPACVEHPRLLIDMRRHLVDQGEIDEGLQDALMNIQRYGNSFGQSPRKRGDWTKTLDFKLANAQQDEVEYLWFAGDYASYDQRAQQVTRAVAAVFRHAGLDVGILADKEQNAGNDVRRVGEEGLFDLLREKNSKVLEKARFRHIVTTDPHTYNTLKNEYRLGGAASATDGGRRVLHYSELLDELIRGGRIVVQRPLSYTVTYHDPCYLGRFNGVYDAPRRVLAALGAKLVEMPRHRANSFCCGAGGGRIWMKDTPGAEERPAENRVREALAVPGVECLVVACPKDLAMFQDAVKTVGAEDRLRVADLGELAYEALGIASEAVVQTGSES